MNLITKFFLFISLFYSCSLFAQSDTLQRFDTEEGSFYFINDAYTHRLIFKSDHKQIVVLGNKDLKSTKKTRRHLHHIIDIKISQGIAGILYQRNYRLTYALYDLNGEERELLNANSFNREEQVRIITQLLDPFTIYERYPNVPERSKISIYSKDMKRQEFTAKSGIVGFKMGGG